MFFFGIVWRAIICVLVAREPSFAEPIQGFVLDSASATKVEFETEILPILKAHCLDCHGEKHPDGDFRLTTESLARRGGHTGQPIFADTPEDSEFYKRIVSTDADYRMPKGDQPLATEQTQMIKRWIEQGASWGAVVSISPDHEPVISPPATNTPSSDLSRSLSGRVGDFLFRVGQVLGRPQFQYLKYLAWLMGAWWLLVVATIVRRRYQKRSLTAKVEQAAVHEQNNRKRCDKIYFLWALDCLNWRTVSLLFAGMIVLSIIALLLGRIDELNGELGKLQSSVRVQKSETLSLDRANLTMPVYPQHPPRLGGVYYRGNDERSEALFNGGFYRTATMELYLVNERGDRLSWGDLIATEPVFIQLTIRRAPKTTAMLFTERIFKETWLRRFRETELTVDLESDESVEIPFEVVEPDQVWQAKILLESSHQWKDGRTAGVVYLFYGAQVFEGMKGRAHYGIRYEIELTKSQHSENKISEDSVLWMGSIYDLGGRVLIPQSGEILLDHWFDFRPIPEIEADNPDDPELLGIPEHKF